MLIVTNANDRTSWNSFLASQKFRPFLQSWEMGEVYGDLGHEIVRLEIKRGSTLVGICFGHVVPARRGRHLSVPYGPVLRTDMGHETLDISALFDELRRIAKNAGCSFVRMSPMWPVATDVRLETLDFRPAPLHLLAEHLWYLPLVEPDPWRENPKSRPGRQAGETRNPKQKEEIFKAMRATHRNLIRRAEKEGVTITVSDNPLRDLPFFLTLHDETRKRHGFTPYTNAFFRAQVKHFSSPNTYNLTPNTSLSCALYLANYKEEVIAASIHMHFAGETSYHHGASSQKYRNIPASYLLQWRAIQDASQRGDHIYNFWGIAPLSRDGQEIFSQEKQPQGSPVTPLSPCEKISCPARHPFAGVTTFKTGFGGQILELQHCMDLPLSPTYYLTRGFEIFRKWRRGF